MIASSRNSYTRMTTTTPCGGGGTKHFAGLLSRAVVLEAYERALTSAV